METKRRLIQHNLQPNRPMEEVPAGLKSEERSSIPILELESPLRRGWERCLDLESGLIFFKNRETGTRIYSQPAPDDKRCTSPAGGLQSAEVFACSEQTRSPCRELELFPLPFNSISRARDERHERELRSRDLCESECRTSPSSSSASSVTFRGGDRGVEDRGLQKRKRSGEDGMRLQNGSDGPRAMVLAGCPRCLMYVMFWKSNRRCPNCGHAFLGHQGIISFEPKP